MTHPTLRETALRLAIEAGSRRAWTFDEVFKAADKFLAYLEKGEPPDVGDPKSAPKSAQRGSKREEALRLAIEADSKVEVVRSFVGLEKDESRRSNARIVARAAAFLAFLDEDELDPSPSPGFMVGASEPSTLYPFSVYSPIAAAVPSGCSEIAGLGAEG